MSDTRQYYLSIDCATRSLAVGFYSCISNVRSVLSSPTEGDLDSAIQVHWINLIDLTDGKKATDVSALDKARSLKSHMTKIKKQVHDTIGEEMRYNILIEFQMNVNDKSRAVYNQLLYEFCDCGDIVCMPPALKNTVYLHKGLMHGEFMDKCSSNYQANKNHSKYNFVYYLCIYNQLGLLKGIKAKNYDDVADTFMQFLAHIILN
jgi:hypothetical protein